MKKIVFSVLFVLILISGFGVSINEFFNYALGENSDYELILLNRVKYQMDYDKGIIEATTEKDQLNAEKSYYSNINSEKNDMVSLYQGFLSDLFNVYDADINLRKAEFNLADASETYQNNIILNQKNIVSDSDLKESKLTFEEEQINYNTSLRDYNDYLKDFIKLTDISAEEVVFTLLNPEEIFVSDEIYLSNDLSLKTSELTLKISEYDLENMSKLSSEYDLKDQEILVKQNKYDYEDTLESSEEANEDYIVNLGDKYNTVYINEAKFKLNEEEFEDIQERYEKGLISDSDYRSSYSTLLSSESNYLSAIQNYLNVMIEYIVYVGGEVSSFNF